MAPPGFGNPDDGSVSRPSHKSDAEPDVIDVDALDCDNDNAPSTDREGMTEALRQAKEPIDVDDPASWTAAVPSSVSGPARVGPPPPLL